MPQPSMSGHFRCPPFLMPRRDTTRYGPACSLRLRAPGARPTPARAGRGGPDDCAPRAIHIPDSEDCQRGGRMHEQNQRRAALARLKCKQRAAFGRPMLHLFGGRLVRRQYHGLLCADPVERLVWRAVSVWSRPGGHERWRHDSVPGFGCNGWDQHPRLHAPSPHAPRRDRVHPDRHVLEQKRASGGPRRRTCVHRIR